MSIGIVDDNSFEAELKALTQKSSPDNTRASVIDKPSRGRDVGDNNVPDSLRKIIGETSVIEGRGAALDLAKEFGISASSVSAYAKGATSTTSYNNPTKSIIGHINKSRERAVRKASKTLNSALSAISQDKLDYADAKDLSGIAKDMSVIIRNLEPPSQQVERSETPQFVIFAPQFRKEESFEVIDVKE